MWTTPDERAFFLAEVERYEDPRDDFSYIDDYLDSRLKIGLADGTVRNKNKARVKKKVQDNA